MIKSPQNSRKKRVPHSRIRRRTGDRGPEPSNPVQPIGGASEDEEEKHDLCLVDESYQDDRNGLEDQRTHNLRTLALGNSRLLKDKEKILEPKELEVIVEDSKEETRNIKKLNEEKISDNLANTKNEFKTQKTPNSNNTEFMIFLSQLLLKSSSSPELKEYLTGLPELLEDTSESLTHDFNEKIKVALGYKVKIEIGFDLMFDMNLEKGLYTGQYAWDYLPHGFGALVYSYKNVDWIYVGPFRKGKRHGMGIHKKVGDHLFEVRTWKNDEPEVVKTSVVDFRQP